MRSKKPEQPPQQQPFVIMPWHILDQFKAGIVTPGMMVTYALLVKGADWETGIWHGAAGKIEHESGGQINGRTAQYHLRQLCDVEQLKSFHKKGSRQDYDIAIHNFEIRVNCPLKGKWLDAMATTDPRNPVYVDGNPLVEKPVSAQTIALKTPPQRNDSAIDCGDKGSSAQRHRNDSATTPQPIAGNNTDVSDFEDNPDPKPSRPTSENPDGGMDGGTPEPVSQNQNRGQEDSGSQNRTPMTLWTAIVLKHRECREFLLNEVKKPWKLVPPFELSRVGLPELEKFVAACDYSREEVLATFQEWYHTYAKSMGTEKPIQHPLTLFAKDAHALLIERRKDAAEDTEDEPVPA